MDQHTLRIHFDRHDDSLKFRIKLESLDISHEPLTRSGYHVVDVYIGTLTSHKMWALRRTLEKIQGWRGAGPWCVRNPNHGPMTLVRSSLALLYGDGYWKCCSVECTDEKLIEESFYEPMRNFIRNYLMEDYSEPLKELPGITIYPSVQTIVQEVRDTIGDISVRLHIEPENKASNDKSPKDYRMTEHMKHVVPKQLHNHFQQDVRDSETEPSSNYKKSPKETDEDIAKLKNQITELEIEIEHLVTQMKGLNIMNPKFSKILDEAYRFLCGLNLQDHSVADQREYLRIVRELKPFIITLKGLK